MLRFIYNWLLVQTYLMSYPYHSLLVFWIGVELTKDMGYSQKESAEFLTCEMEKMSSVQWGRMGRYFLGN